MKTARAKSVERTKVSEKVPDKCSAEKSKIKELIENLGEKRNTNKRWGIMDDLYEKYGYQQVGDSNSIWGRQFRVIKPNAHSFEDHQPMIKAAENLGMAIQKVKNENLHIFFPITSRYLPFDHEKNRPYSDVVVQHNNRNGNLQYIEIIGKKKILNYLYSTTDEVIPRGEFGVIRCKNKSTDYFIRKLKDMRASFSVMNGGLKRFPIYQWSPEKEMVSVKRKKKKIGWNYSIHALNSDNNVKCGLLDKDDTRVVFYDTMKDMDNEITKWCNHPACKKNL